MYPPEVTNAPDFTSKLPLPWCTNPEPKNAVPVPVPMFVAVNTVPGVLFVAPIVVKSVAMALAFA